MAGCIDPLVVGKSADSESPIRYTEPSDPSATADALSADDPASVVNQITCDPSGESFAANASIVSAVDFGVCGTIEPAR